MDYKYDAFISYRHAEKDTLIASEIQSSLERFNIPKELRKKTGKQRFNRVFRDVEELPISSNLTEDLEEALRSSEYLIVICSYRTSESDWVKREIDTFLELHDYNKQLILTVLVEGEPDEVVPEILRHDNITHYLADGSFYCRDEVVEPLSADYRMPIPKARKIELPRLAATMLGCNYDDIIKRRKAYKRTRLLIETAIISLAAIALMAYIGVMFMRIQEGLRNSQMNQARYLASESQKLLDDGDRIGAIQLALAALVDNDGKNRPVTSEARYALSQALGSYSTKGTTNSAPVWRYETSSAIMTYMVNSTYDRLAILDANGKLDIWNLQDHTLVKTLEGDESRFIDCRYDKDDNLIIVNTHGVALYDAKDWSVKWNYKINKTLSKQDNLIAYYKSNGYIALNCNNRFCVIDSANGSVINEIDISKYETLKEKADSTSVFKIERFAFNNDFSKIAFAGSEKEFDNYALYIYDIESDKWSGVIEDSGSFIKLFYDADDNLFVLRRSKEDNAASYYNKTDMIYDASVIIEKISANGKSAWKTEIPSFVSIYNPFMNSGEYYTKDGGKTAVVVAVFGNKLVYVDKKSGKAVKTYDLPDSGVAAGVSSDTATVITRDGMLYGFPLVEGKNRAISGTKFFMDGVVQLLVFRDENNRSQFLVEDSTNKVITEYSSNFADTKYKEFSGTESMPLINGGVKLGKYLITYGLQNSLSCSDLDTRKVLWTKQFPSDKNTILDKPSPDNKYVFFVQEVSSAEKTYKLVRVNCLDGEFTDANSEFPVTKRSGFVICQGKIWEQTYDSKESKLTLYSYDMSNDTVNKTVVDLSKQAQNNFRGGLKVSPDGKQAVVYFSTRKDDQELFIRIVINCESGKYTEYETGTCLATFWNENGKKLAEVSSDLGVINVVSSDGKLLHSINTELRTPRAVSFYKDRLYVLYTDDVLCGYDAMGKKLINIDLGHGELSRDAVATFDFIHDYLFLTVGKYTDIINLTDGKSIDSIAGFLCLYDKNDNDLTLSEAIVVCKSFTDGYGNVMGYFEYKTTDKLIAQAKEFIKGTTVSEEFKRKYGLE